MTEVSDPTPPSVAPRPRPAVPARRWPFWPLLGSLLLTALLLWAYAQDVSKRGPLWRDEANSAAFVEMPLPKAWAMLRYDSFPLGFTALTKLWTTVAGTSDKAYRVWGGLIALGVVASLWIATLTLARAGPCVAVALLFSPLTVFQICGLRPYGLSICTNLLATAALFAAVGSAPAGRRRVWRAAAVLACVAAVQVLYNNTALVAAAVIGAAVTGRLRDGWRGVVWPLIAGAVAALSLLPYLSRIAAARDWAVVVHDPGHSFVADTWATFSAAVDGETSPATLTGRVAVACLVLLAVPLLAWAVRFARRHAPADPLAAGLCVSLACGVVFYVMFLRSTGAVPSAWYFAPVLPFAGVLADGLLVGLSAGRGAWPTLVVLGRPLVTAVLAGMIYLQNADGFSVQATNVPDALREVAARARPGDLIVLDPWFLGITFARYDHGTVPWTTLPRLPAYDICRYDRIKRLEATPDAERPELDRVNATLRAGGSVWLITQFLPAPRPLPPGPLVAPWADNGWQMSVSTAYWRNRLDNLVARDGAVTEANEVPPTTGAEQVWPYEEVVVVRAQLPVARLPVSRGPS